LVARSSSRVRQMSLAVFSGVGSTLPRLLQRSARRVVRQRRCGSPPCVTVPMNAFSPRLSAGISSKPGTALLFTTAPDRPTTHRSLSASVHGDRHFFRAIAICVNDARRRTRIGDFSQVSSRSRKKTTNSYLAREQSRMPLQNCWQPKAIVGLKSAREL